MQTLIRPITPFFAYVFTGAAIFGALTSAGRAADVTLSPTNAHEFQQALTDASDNGQYAGQPVIIYLAPGTYKTGTATGNKPFSYHSTSTLSHLQIGGIYGHPTQVVLDGQGATQVLNIQNTHADTQVAFLTIQNGETPTALGGGLAINTSGGGGSVSVHGNIIRNNHSGDYGGGFEIEGGGSQISMVNNLVVGNAADNGIGAGDLFSSGTGAAFVLLNTVYKNTTTASGGTGGMRCCGTSPAHPAIDGNIFWQNTNFGIDLEGSSAYFEYNDVGTYTGVTPQADVMNLMLNPNFVDAANDDYRLAGNSPLLAYCPQQMCGQENYDLAGNNYPQSGFVDLGAYEETIFINGFDGN